MVSVWTLEAVVRTTLRRNGRELLVFWSKAVREPVQAKHAHFSGIFGTGTTNSWRLFIGPGNLSDV
jgi:hypothetical protein